MLTVNIFVFVGIVLFSVYCKIQDRSVELLRGGGNIETITYRRSNLVDKQAILERLEHLENVVFHQLNGNE